jgi:pyruvate,orthophosphate dikinase
MGKKFGDENNPLLISVRSGARISMPGMMDTILNLGMNDRVAEGLAKNTGNRRFALDSYRRFIEMYGSTVLSISKYLFEDALELKKIQSQTEADGDLSEEALEEIVQSFKAIIRKYSGSDFPEDPYVQLQESIKAVLNSWNSPRAVVYRKLSGIHDDLGTAVNVQSMVFGNMGNSSATGVVFTRNPSTGENKLFGEFLVNAQGEDVVAGVRTPSPISDHEDSMQNLMPSVFKDLQEICQKLELHYHDMQDIEFTVEDGKLYILQTRSGKRTAGAAVKITVDLHNEGIITKQEALLRIDPESLNQLLHTSIDYSQSLKSIAQGLPASPGAATGIAVFSPYDAEELSHHHKVILVRNDTSPEDISGMHVSSGILTARGGMTSHAAVVTRGMGKPCICGVSGIIIDEKNKTIKVGDLVINHGDEITIDGGTGKLFLGKVPLIQPTFSDEFKTLLSWADDESKLKVRANAETPIDTAVALKFGAVGIGLCRTEHMFFDAEKIPLVREMIIAPDLDHRAAAISKLLPLQIQDFKEIFRVLKGRPVNLRLLDPPLHEFLPAKESDKQELAKIMELPLSVIEQRLHAMHEVNPMLGHRGCRLGITYPEIYKMQMEAICAAIQELKGEENIDTELELMIPLVNNRNELQNLKEHILPIAEGIKITVGTMIELPRACIKAGEIAEEVEYFSFGTNDLTQTTFGISRDDIASFLPEYLDKKIFVNDPFIVLDEEGVGELIEIAIVRARKIKPHLKLGVCGEHAGNPKSIDFFHRVGIDYISCSPYRIPIARIAAAQAKIRNQNRENQ